MLDFIALSGWLGWECIPDPLAAYKLSLNDGFMARLQFLGRVLTLEWLYRAGGDVVKHRRWVHPAFDSSAFD